MAHWRDSVFFHPPQPEQLCGKFVAVAYLRFGQDFAHVLFDRLNMDLEVASDLAIAPPVEHAAEDLFFAVGQPERLEERLGVGSRSGCGY